MKDDGAKSQHARGSAGQRWNEPIKIKYLVGEQELKEARLLAEEAQKAWREEHDARVEAEEAKAAVVKAAEEALAEAAELKKRLSAEIEEAKQKTRAAVQARKLYEEAKEQSEEAKALWREACRRRLGGQADDKLVVSAQAVEERIEYSLKWVD